MKNISRFPESVAATLQYFLFDIDDTVTQNGLLPSTSLKAMEDLQSAGLKLIAVTGRPAGWCDHIARMWPVDAVVGENGAFWFSYDQTEKTMLSGFAKSEPERALDQKRLQKLKKTILEKIPGTGIASDQHYRIADLAIDFSEDVKTLSDTEIARIASLFEAAGATAKISSIHVNGWFGDYDKLSMTRTCMKRRFQTDIEEKNDQSLFVGDSPNDQPMFAYFQNSVGVANVKDFSLTTPPVWVTNKRAAEGFAELAAKLLKLR